MTQGVTGPFLAAKGGWTVIVNHLLSTGATLATHHRFGADAERAATFASEQREGPSAAVVTPRPARPRDESRATPEQIEAGEGVLLQFLPREARRS